MVIILLFASRGRLAESKTVIYILYAYNGWSCCIGITMMTTLYPAVHNTPMRFTALLVKDDFSSRDFGAPLYVYTIYIYDYNNVIMYARQHDAKTIIIKSVSVSAWRASVLSLLYTRTREDGRKLSEVSRSRSPRGMRSPTSASDDQTIV